MSRFVEHEGKFIKIDEDIGKHSIFVQFSDPVDPQMGKLTKSHSLRQVIPCESPIYSVWMLKDGACYAKQIEYLGLFSDGEIRGLDLSGGRFRVPDGDIHYYGLVSSGELKEFESLEVLN